MCTTNAHGRLTPVITVTMTDQDVIENAAKILGTRAVLVKAPPSRVTRLNYMGTYNPKPMFRARVRGARAAGWMMTLYSFMGQRRKHQIRTALKKWRSEPSTKRGSSLLWAHAARAA